MKLKTAFFTILAVLLWIVFFIFLFFPDPIDGYEEGKKYPPYGYFNNLDTAASDENEAATPYPYEREALEDQMIIRELDGKRSRNLKDQNEQSRKERSIWRVGKYYRLTDRE